ncbi:carbohydrate ABC transporter membrane protein 2 (CUT1 family) [Microterricola gilva]|uniref:Carbohydrate ABC transporter membrane protein 2 (CUT1 family) n=1 Tax=Microterricola gilva TaxID=393267 RepID=A0A4Q8AHK1_9MICO|nr:carbohydrate ABC transporter permease [Microterricola gilva]RZU63882.1 carbohydrate ABC transporter membrane protein 2 (CUT1 family) [Microterricola gilva]
MSDTATRALVAPNHPVRLSKRPLTPAARINRVLIYVLVVIMGLFCLIPFAWLVFASVDENASSTLAWPEFTLQHYVELFTEAQTLQLLGNSLIIAVGATALTILLGTLGGYALSRFRFPFRRSFMFFILLIRVVPPTATIVPLYLIVVNLGLNDSLFGLVLVEAAALLPLTLWQMKIAVDSIPIELEEAAWVDGGTRFRAFRIIVFPLVGPTLGAAAMFAFMGAWGDFLTPLVLLQSPELYPLSIGLFYAFSEFNQVNWGVLTATAMIYMVPPTVLYLLVRKYLFKASLSGAVKG